MSYYKRNILKELVIWKKDKNRKPLIIRGARQTGKTVAVELFAESFSNFIHLNLERDSDRNVFENSPSVEAACQGIELLKGKNPFQPDTLLFIDEIQNSSKAISLLRFFYEDHPEIFVICAGSLLEAIMKKDGFAFPVGRVEFLYMHPLTFDEYLTAGGNERVLNQLQHATGKTPPSRNLHEISSELFREYAFVGGMPAVVKDFIESKSYTRTADIKEAIFTALKDDVSKYSHIGEAKYLRHVIEYAPYSVGERIKYEKFGNSAYRGREIKHAFELLEYAMIGERVYGAFATESPVMPNFRVSPKILYLDSGLVIHKLGLTPETRNVVDLNSLFRGTFAEQVAGQALAAKNVRKKNPLCFWYRNTPGSIAETDYLCLIDGKLVPIEVKSGKAGSLKSLYQFMSASSAKTAVRFYSGELKQEDISFKNRKFNLISIPFYLMWRFEDILED